MSIILKATTFLLKSDFCDDNEDVSEDYRMYEYKLHKILQEVQELECFQSAKRH